MTFLNGGFNYMQRIGLRMKLIFLVLNFNHIQNNLFKERVANFKEHTNRIVAFLC